MFRNLKITTAYTYHILATNTAHVMDYFKMKQTTVNPL